MTSSLPDEPKPGDILVFARAKRGRDYIIKLLTFSRYYHVALYDGDWHVVEARPKGVGRNDLRGREGAFVVVPAPKGKGQAALDWAKTQKGAGFDRKDMLVTLLEHLFVRFHLNIVPKGKFNCAELVATAFDKAGLRLLPDRDLNDFEPKDFAGLLPPGVKPQPCPLPASESSNV